MTPLKKRRSLAIYRPVRPGEPVYSREDAPDLLLWLDAASGVASRGAVTLDGTSQYLSRAGSLMGTLGTNYSVQAWVWLSGGSGTSRTIAAHRSTAQSNPIGFYLGISSSDSSARFIVTGDSGTGATAIGPALPTGQWHHVVGVRSGGSLSIYVNGVAGTVASASFGTITPTHLDLGSNFGGSTSRLHLLPGRLDQFGVWGNRALSQADVTALFNSGSGLSYSGMPPALRAGLVMFHELDGNPVAGVDSTGNGHTLTPIGSPAAADGVAEGPADDSDPVLRWADRHGGPAFSQAAVAARPAWRSAGFLDFDGTDDRLGRDSGPLVGARPGFTMLARLRLDVLPSGSPAVVYTEADSGASVVNRLAITPAGQVVASYRPIGGTLASATSAATLAAGADAVIGVRRNGSDLRVFVAGAPSGPAATIDHGTDLAGASCRVGGPVESAGFRHLDGRITEIYAVGRALTDPQIAALSNPA
ncbi:LamG domain-containing protein [Tautonia plasticadhaerens]|uniref:LamG domain-containing protein n=1 Tax=Tautonia plasticadhaerens TaxID=2527974 RepID=UPI0011A9E60D|nr:LamG domain-containing protein [Tautonia plasticadhaerens]